MSTKRKPKHRGPTDTQIRQLAKKRYEREGTLEIDEGAEVSRGFDNGAYVQAWVWVEFEDSEDDLYA